MNSDIAPSEPVAAQPSIWFASNTSEVIGHESTTTADGREAPATVTSTNPGLRVKRRTVAIGLGGLLVAGLLTAGVVSDIKVRHSLDSTQGDLTSTTDKLKAANAQLATQSSELTTLHAQVAQNATTIADQKQKLADAAVADQQLTTCNGALVAFLQDLASNQVTAARRDYPTAYQACAVAGVELPLP